MAILRIVDAYRSRPIEIVVEPGETENSSWKLKRTSGWYDFTVSAANDSTFLYRAAGHLEDGDDSISDPLMGGLVQRKTSGTPSNSFLGLLGGLCLHL